MKNHYYYDSEACEFVPIDQSRSDLVIYTVCLWILNGLVIGILGLSLLSNYIATPAEIALKSENQTLLQQFQQTRSTIVTLETEVKTLVQADTELFRSVFGMDPLSDQELAGTGGTDPYSEFDLHSKDASELMRWTASRLDQLERRIEVQKVSFNEIQNAYNQNREMLSHLPVIKPVNGTVISGYGMRMHPILRYNRMHEGLDFRADTGTPIYATGNGRVETSGRHGSYGLLIELDHGHGYMTRYAHLSSFEDGIRPGAEIERGDLIGYSGNTGLSQGPHLHYEVLADGRAVDPITYLIADTTPEEYQMYQEVARDNPMSMD